MKVCSECFERAADMNNAGEWLMFQEGMGQGTGRGFLIEVQIVVQSSFTKQTTTR